MGSWVTVTDDQAMPKGAPERATIAGIKGVDDLAEIISECVETFRDAIRSSGQPLGPDGTIAPSLKQYVIERAIWIFVTRGVAQNKVLQTDARRKGAERAESILEKIISKDLKIIGDDPTATISHGVSVVRPGRHIRTTSFDKLGET